MVDSVGSMANNSYYQTLYNNYLELKKTMGGELSFQSYLRKLNVDYSTVMQGFENVIETGDARKGDGVDGNTISNSRHVNGENNTQMYQTEDQEGFYDINWDTGEYKYMTDTQEVAKTLGLDTDNYQFDTIVFGAGSAEVTDFVFSNLSDGQQREEYTVNGSYRNITYAVQEFDPCYILDSALQDATDEEYQKALNNWEYLSATVTQWITDAELEALNELEPNSAEYKQALIDLILEKLDQTQSFGDHTHVENKNAVDAIENITGTETGVTDSESGTVPEYDRSQVMYNSSISNDYTSGVSRATDTRSEDKQKVKSEALSMAQSDLNAAASALKAQLGDQLTDAISAYIDKAIQNTLQYLSENTRQWQCGGDYRMSTTDDRLGYGDRHDGKDKVRGVYNVQAVVNHFFDEFNTLCANNGKSSAEVQAEAEEKERLKGEYQTFYNFNVKSVTVEGTKSEYTVSMTGGNYKNDAKNNVIDPYKEAAIKAIKQKCPNISESQIEKIINAAAESTLSKTSWVTTNGNIATGGTYTINTDKLLDEFNAQIKAAIKASGAYNPDEA